MCSRIKDMRLGNMFMDTGDLDYSEAIFEKFLWVLDEILFFFLILFHHWNKLKFNIIQPDHSHWSLWRTTHFSLPSAAYTGWATFTKILDECWMSSLWPFEFPGAASSSYTRVKWAENWLKLKCELQTVGVCVCLADWESCLCGAELSASWNFKKLMIIRK